MKPAIEKTRAEIDPIICTSYGAIGGDIREVAHIRPEDGGWDNARSYEVTLKDGRKALVARRYVDDENRVSVMDALRGFR